MIDKSEKFDLAGPPGLFQPRHSPHCLAGQGIAFTLVAISLLLFGLFSLLLARYRIIPDLDVDGKVPAFRP